MNFIFAFLGIVGLIFIVNLVCSLYCTIRYKQSILKETEAFREYIPKLTLFISLAYAIIAPLYIFTNSFTFEKDGTLCYVVQVDNKYYLPAQIEKKGRQYKIVRAYWPNGGYLTFDGGEDYLIPNEEVVIYDANDKLHYLQLTTKRSSHPKIVENLYFSWSWDYTLILIAFVGSILFIVPLKEEEKPS